MHCLHACRVLIQGWTSGELHICRQPCRNGRKATGAVELPGLLAFSPSNHCTTHLVTTPTHPSATLKGLTAGGLSAEHESGASRRGRGTDSPERGPLLEGAGTLASLILLFSSLTG
jgi:hypothetical protein